MSSAAEAALILRRFTARLKPRPGESRAVQLYETKNSALCADGRGKPRPYEGKGAQAEACATQSAADLYRVATHNDRPQRLKPH